MLEIELVDGNLQIRASTQLLDGGRGEPELNRPPLIHGPERRAQVRPEGDLRGRAGQCTLE